VLRRLRHAVDAAAGGLPPTFWWLWLGMLVNRLGSFVVPYLAIYITSQRGASVAQAGVIASLYGAGSIGSGPVGGALADRVGRRATLLAALVAAGAVTIALGFVERLEIIGAGVLLLGFVQESFRPAMQAAVADLVPDLATRVRAFGLIYWAVNLGFAVALVVAGWLAHVGYRWLFAADGATTLLFAVVVALKVPETRPRAAAGAHASALSGLAATFRDGVLVTFISLNLAFAMILWQAHTALPVDMIAKGLTPAGYGSLMALNGVVIVLTQPFLTRALAGRDTARVLAAAAVLAGAGWGLNALATTLPAFALGILVWTFGEIANNPVGAALVGELAPVHLRGRYQGAYGLSWSLGSAVGPGLGAYVLGRFGSSALWTGCLALGLLLGGAHLAAGGPRRRRLAVVRAGAVAGLEAPVSSTATATVNSDCECPSTDRHAPSPSPSPRERAG
jgi:MFS family permease